ncbi:MAG: hypothetical protein R3D26_22475 [Cyanobacteriota/Melainabacteria group bacterium]
MRISDRDDRITGDQPATPWFSFAVAKEKIGSNLKLALLTEESLQIFTILSAVTLD